jgi:predicted Fe-Mo cluster-binding NifX family protein
MKIAITADEPKFETQLEPRFGRCVYFVIVDSETHDWESLNNPAAEAMGGAGPQAAQFLSDQGVSTVISGDFGPKAFTALQAADIHMFRSEVNKIESIYKKFQNRELDKVSEPTGPQRHAG